MKDGVNNRTDEYEGSLENRCRFPLEVVEAAADKVGADRVGYRISLFTNHGLRRVVRLELGRAWGVHDKVRKQVQHSVCTHVMEPRMVIVEGRRQIPHRLSSIRQAFNGSFIAAGCYDKDEGNRVIVEGYCDLVAFGWLFFAKLDLPKRFISIERFPSTNTTGSPFKPRSPLLATHYPILQDLREEEVVQVQA